MYDYNIWYVIVNINFIELYNTFVHGNYSV